MDCGLPFPQEYRCCGLCKHAAGRGCIVPDCRCHKQEEKCCEKCLGSYGFGKDNWGCIEKGCPCHKQEDKIEGHELGFDKPLSVNDLIAEAIAAERARLVEVVEGMKYGGGCSGTSDSCGSVTYNKALSDVLAVLKEETKTVGS